MNPLPPLRILAGFFALAGAASASVLFVLKDKPDMVTTRFIPSAGFQYHAAAGSEVVEEPQEQATMIIAQETRAVAPPRRSPAPQPKPTKGGDLQAAVLCNRGLMQMQAGEYRGATLDFDSAMRLSPKYQRAYMLRGVVAAQQGNHGEALGYYNRALEIGQGTPEVHQSRGLTYLKLQRFKEALDDFSKAVSLDPDFEEAYLKRGLLYGRMGEFEKSIADNTKAIALNPKNPLPYNNRAAAYQALGLSEEADADLRKSTELEAQDKEK